MLCSLRCVQAKALLLSSVALVSHAPSFTVAAQENLPDVTVVQSKPPKAKKPVKAVSQSHGGGEQPAEAVERPAYEDVGVGTSGLSVPLTTTRIDSSQIQSRIPQTSDTAELLRDAPGVSIFKGGGVSGLPVINGLNDDRVKVLLNGMVVTSAAPTT